MNTINVIGRMALLFAAFAFPLSAARAEGEAKRSCCPVELKADPASTRDAMASAQTSRFTRDSIYQMDGAFVTDRGEKMTLGELRGEPVLVSMFFASCTYACPLLLTDMTLIRGELPDELRGRVRLVLISFDTVRDTPEALAAFRASRGLDARWTLLTAEPGTVLEIAALLGIKYTPQADGQFAHSNNLVVLNREGEIVHQREGLRTPTADTIRALADAAR